MSSSKITLIGMYNYDNTIFDNLTFPPGVDKSLAVNEILMECGEFEILYPDFDFLKYQITKWGSKHYFTFEKWLKALAEEFNPIHNYDRYESYTDSHTGSGKQIDSEKREDKDNRFRALDASSEHSEDKNGNIIGSSSNDQSEDKTSNSITSSQTDRTEEKTSDSNGASFTDTHSTTDDDVKRNVSAYDSSLYQPKEQEVTDGETSGNGSGTSMSHVKDETGIKDSNNNLNQTVDSTSSNGSNNSMTQSSDNMTASDSDKHNEFEGGSSSGSADRQSEHQNTDINKHEAHLYGNIGVTTSVAMLKEFTGFYKDFNLYEQIASLFVDEFCIRIY